MMTIGYAIGPNRTRFGPGPATGAGEGPEYRPPRGHAAADGEDGEQDAAAGSAADPANAEGCWFDPAPAHGAPRLSKRV